MTNQIVDYELCDASDLENNSMKEIEIKLPDKIYKVLLIKSENKFSCLANTCSHYPVPLAFGVLYKGRIRCMAHGSCFNVQTGDIEDYPGPDCLATYKVFVTEENKVRIKTTRAELDSKKRLRVETNPNRLASEISTRLVTDRSLRVGSASITRPKTSVARPGSASALNVQPAKNTGAKILIIGSGAAAIVCLDTLREHGIQGTNLTMITKDNFYPYDRPKLSKDFKIEPKSAIIRDETYFTEHGINFQRNQDVEKIDFNGKLVTCKSGKQFPYDKLIISTGLRPVNVLNTVPGRDLKGIFTLRSLQDALHITDYYNSLKALMTEQRKLNIVHVGGSFISMEAVGFFAEELGDKANHIVVSRNKPFENLFGKDAAKKIEQLHLSKGVQFVTEKNFEFVEFKESATESGCLGSFNYSKGDSNFVNQPADLCILALGGRPNTNFLDNTQINMNKNKYVIVDKNMKTNLDDVFAIGDITVFPSECLINIPVNEPEINIQHWSVACTQGRSAALSIINQSRTEKLNSDLRLVPFFWSTQLKKAIRFAGFNKTYDSIVFHEDPSKQNPLKFAAFYLSQDKVVGVATLDWDPICSIFAETLYNRIEVKREHIDKEPMDLKKLLTY